MSLIPNYDPVATAEDCTYDEAAGNKAVRFIETYLKHPHGQWANEPFKLADWQRYLIQTIFGWHNPDGTRRYRIVFCEIPKGNGKSELGAAIALYFLFCEPYPGKRIFGCAGNADQANTVLSKASGMVKLNRKLQSGPRRVVEIRKRSIELPNTDSVYKVITSSGETKHGEGISLCVFDETWVQKDGDLWEAMTSGMRGQKSPLLISISTAGWDRNSLMYREHEYALKVRSGMIQDKSYLPCIFAASIEDDWRDEQVWRKANPNLECCNLLPHLRAELRAAEASPFAEAKFKRLYLNIWTASEAAWIADETWMQCKGEVNIPDGANVFLGVDLSSTRDLSAVVLMYVDGGKYYLKPMYWIPKDNIEMRERIDNVPYQDWCKRGLVEATTGTRIDYDYIKAYILKLCEQYKVRCIAYDPRMATHLMADIQELGYEVIEIPWRADRISPACKEWERLCSEGLLVHDGNPVLRWNVQNTTLDEKREKFGLWHPKKASEYQRIDGLVAALMCLDRAQAMAEDTDASLLFI